MAAADPVIQLLQLTISQHVIDLCRDHLSWLATGNYEAILACDQARDLFREHHKEEPTLSAVTWLTRLTDKLNNQLLVSQSFDVLVVYFCIGYAALLTFMQANVTGPPLTFRPETYFVPDGMDVSKEAELEVWRDQLKDSLKSEGVAVYNLATNIELLCVARVAMGNPILLNKLPSTQWVKMRTDFTHQRLLAETSSSLETTIFDDLSIAQQRLDEIRSEHNADGYVCLLLEQAAAQLYYGHQQQARQSLARATEQRRFEFKLTGRLGKRTRYQQHETSQLVVLAKSASEHNPPYVADHSRDQSQQDISEANGATSAKPQDLLLNDDTLLERIEFHDNIERSLLVATEEGLPMSLRALNPSTQPQLQPLDSIILLAYASSITNNSPEHGLTREEMLPYATRVLEGGSSNWQVYTQALLVRSRIEAYSSRTAERGLLQLQALVDQVIVETSTDITYQVGESRKDVATSFLRASTDEHSAPVQERLQYVFQLASPMRWELEAELAARWVQLGGLKTALEIYERLRMWAEAALCLAATEQEERARVLIKQQLFRPSMTDNDGNTTEGDGLTVDPPPSDAPRLYCILGDMDQRVSWYEAAWTVSDKRYARAQRSMGRLYLTRREFAKAVTAYTKSLSVNQLNEQSWFALGCALLELQRYEDAVEAFSRCVQLDGDDAEAWSNLGAALLKIDVTAIGSNQHSVAILSADDQKSLSQANTKTNGRQKNLVNALKAFQRASTIKHDSYRIWQNILVTAAAVAPPEYATILNAQRRIIELRSTVEGEACIDDELLEILVKHVISTTSEYDPQQAGLARMTVRFMDESVIPLVTTSSRLWRLISLLSIWRKRPAAALEAEEKAWRAATSLPGWESDDEQAWSAVVEATVRLSDAYESLGPQEKTEGLAAGSGQLVARDWKFKARSAIRGILSKAKDSWADSPGWDELIHAQQSLTP